MRQVFPDHRGLHLAPCGSGVLGCGTMTDWAWVLVALGGYFTIGLVASVVIAASMSPTTSDSHDSVWITAGALFWPISLFALIGFTLIDVFSYPARRAYQWSQRKAR